MPWDRARVSNRSAQEHSRFSVARSAKINFNRHLDTPYDRPHGAPYNRQLVCEGRI